MMANSHRRQRLNNFDLRAMQSSLLAFSPAGPWALMPARFPLFRPASSCLD
jgi:hypothetical protein